MEIIFKKWKCSVNLAHYTNGRRAILLWDYQDGSPVATATVNLVFAKCEPDEVFIKNYSENEGMTDTLIENEIIEKEPTGSDRSGFEIIFKYRLTPEMIKLFEELEDNHKEKAKL
jgi:hypothetical protein